MVKKKLFVIGTYRKKTNKVKELEALGAKTFYCDIKKNNSIDLVSQKISKFGKWNTLVLAAGDQNPIGKIIDLNFNNFEDSIKVNFINQMRFLKNLLKKETIKLQKFHQCYSLQGVVQIMQQQIIWLIHFPK